MNASTFDRLVQAASRARTRRQSVLAVSAAALGTLTAGGSRVRASGAGKKNRKKCGKQVGQCEDVVREYCARFGDGGTACRENVLPCCQSLERCNARSSIQCLIERLPAVFPSDRALKANLVSIEPDTILARVRDLPISTWNYTNDDPSIRHIGPMAQDFAALFQVGADDRHIHPIDAQGVALAAIQGLTGEVERLHREHAVLKALVTAQEQARGASPPSTAR